MRKIGLIFFVSCLLALELGCGDQYRPVANPIVGPGGQPQTVHYAFVLNYNPVGYSTTMKLDVSGDSNVETQTVGAGALGESFLANSTTALFTANSLSDSVSEFSTIGTNNRIVTMNLFAGSKPVAVGTAQNGVVYVLSAGPNSTCPSTGSLSAINISTLVIGSTACVGVNPSTFTQLPNGTKIYVVNGDNTISVYDPGNQNVVATIDAGRGLSPNPVALAASVDSSYVFVVSKSNGVLNIVNTASDTVVASVPLGTAPVSIYLDPNLNRLYVPNSGSNTVTVLDASSVNVNNQPAMTTLGTANVGSGPVSVTALRNGLKVYVANAVSNDVTVLSASSFATLTTLPVGTNPVWIASEPTSTKVYAANAASGNVTIIATSNDSVAATINAPQQDANCSSSCARQQPVMILTF